MSNQANAGNINYTGVLGENPNQAQPPAQVDEGKNVATPGKTKLTVTKKVPDTPTAVVRDEETQTPPIVTPGTPAIVSVHLGRTINTGNFSSAKIEVSISMPCAPADVDNCFKYCYDWADNKIIQALKDEGVEV